MFFGELPHNPANSSLSEVHTWTCCFFTQYFHSVAARQERFKGAAGSKTGEIINARCECVQRENGGVRSKPYNPLPQNNTGIKIQGESRTERGIE